MAVTLYSYNKLCDPGRLSKEIKESPSILIGEDHIETISSPATTKVYMKDALPGEQETALDALVDAHVNTPLPEERTVNVIVKRLKPVYVFKNLVNGSNSPRMNVRGTLVSPVHFNFTPAENEVWEVERLLFGIDDTGLMDFGLFGGLASLTNGIEISVKTDGATSVIGTIKDNVDIAMLFPGTLAYASGVLDAADGMYGTMEFRDHIYLSGASGDYIRMTIKDDLLGINILRAIVVARKLLT